MRGKVGQSARCSSRRTVARVDLTSLLQAQKKRGKKKRRRRNKEGRARARAREKRKREREREKIFETEENEGNKDEAGDGC